MERRDDDPATPARDRRAHPRLVLGGALTGVVLLIAVAVLTRGAGAGGSTGRRAPRLALTAASLSSYADCPALLAGLVERATPLVGPYGLGGGDVRVYGEGAATPAASAAAGAPTSGLAPGLTAGAAPGAPAAPERAGAPYHSSTTDRTRGVDEPDIVKTDGRLLVSVSSGGWLHITDAASARQLGALHLPATGPLTLLLVGRRAIVVGGAVTAPVAPDSTRPVQSSVTVVDLADPAAPVVERTLALTADITGARLLGGTVRLVTRVGAPALRFPPPAPGGDADLDRARTNNLAVVRAATADDWLPSFSVIAHDGRATATGRLYDCAAVQHPSRGDGIDQTGVLSFDPASPRGPAGAVAVLGAGDTTYATGTHVWVATTRGEQPQLFSTGGPARAPAYVGAGGPGYPVPCCEPPFAASGGTTQLHLFDVGDPVGTRYVASGEVPGALHDQTALDEGRDGSLRVVTTGGTSPGTGPSGAATALTILRSRPDATLQRIGRLDGLAAGEQVQAVRFVGDLAYVVTYRQIDPLTVLDVADPTSPRVRGELRTPGYSTLLADAEAGHLLGVGVAAGGRDGKPSVGLALFDVRHPEAPRRLAALSLQPLSTSPALSDPHAFLYWRAARLAMLPLTTYGGSGRGTTALACVRVEPTRLVRVYTLDHTGRAGRGDAGVQRALVVGPHVLTVSDRGVLISSLAAGADQAWAPFAAG